MSKFLSFGDVPCTPMRTHVQRIVDLGAYLRKGEASRKSRKAPLAEVGIFGIIIILYVQEIILCCGKSEQPAELGNGGAKGGANILLQGVQRSLIPPKN